MTYDQEQAIGEAMDAALVQATGTLINLTLGTNTAEPDVLTFWDAVDDLAVQADALHALALAAKAGHAEAKAFIAKTCADWVAAQSFSKLKKEGLL